MSLSLALAPHASASHKLTISRASDVPAVRGTDTLRLALRYAGERHVPVHWALYGDPRAPLVIVQGGISADRQVCANSEDAAPGWWPDQVGAGRAIDTRHHAVLSIDWLGADDALDARIDSADQADALAALLDGFGIERVHAFVGASYGAMVALAFAARHGERVAQTVAISGADRAHPHSTALRLIQRRIVALAAQRGCASDGLALARQLAMLSYRTPRELALRFAEPPVLNDNARFACEPWLDAAGARFVQRFRPSAFLRLSESIDLHRVNPSEIRGALTLVGVIEDQLVPFADVRRLAQTAAGPSRLVRLHSLYGHDAFLKERGAIGRVLREALSTTERAA
jgi:homoserine O-acetyltransferase